MSSDKGGVNIEDNDPNAIHSLSIELPNSVKEIPESVYESVAADLKLNHKEYPQLKSVKIKYNIIIRCLRNYWIYLFPLTPRSLKSTHSALPWKANSSYVTKRSISMTMLSTGSLICFIWRILSRRIGRKSRQPNTD